MSKNFDQFCLPSPDSFNEIDSIEFEEILKKNKKNCLFCKPNSSKKIIYETDNFYVTFDDSPLLEGHIIIHTKIHYGCSGEIPADQMPEFISLKNQVKNMIESSYGSCSFYEHGRAGHCSILDEDLLCEHFHLHALPLEMDISNEITNVSNFKKILLKKTEDILTYYEKYDHYLLYEHKDRLYFYPVTNKIPSHFLRTIIANNIKHPERADWEDCTNLKMINNLKQKMKSQYE